MTGKIVNL